MTIEELIEKLQALAKEHSGVEVKGEDGETFTIVEYSPDENAVAVF